MISWSHNLCLYVCVQLLLCSWWTWNDWKRVRETPLSLWSPVSVKLQYWKRMRETPWSLWSFVSVKLQVKALYSDTPDTNPRSPAPDPNKYQKGHCLLFYFDWLVIYLSCSVGCAFSLISNKKMNSVRTTRQMCCRSVVFFSQPGVKIMGAQNEETDRAKRIRPWGEYCGVNKLALGHGVTVTVISWSNSY